MIATDADFPSLFRVLEHHLPSHSLITKGAIF
jgi:hypothetical protein